MKMMSDRRWDAKANSNWKCRKPAALMLRGSEADDDGDNDDGDSGSATAVDILPNSIIVEFRVPFLVQPVVFPSANDC